MAVERKPGGPVFASAGPLRLEPGERLVAPGLMPCAECDAAGRAWMDPLAHACFHLGQAKHHAAEAVRSAEKAERYGRVAIALMSVSVALAVAALIFAVIS